jgi:hypothetical protein
MGIVSNLFGGGKQKTETTSNPWEPAAELAQNNLIPGINDFNAQYGQGQGLWDQRELGNESGFVRQGQADALRMGEQYGQQYGGVTDTLEGFLDYDPNSAQNQASRDALGNNITAQFNNSIRPGIEDRGTFSGQFGGNQQSIAMGSATQPLSRAIADSEVGLMNADRNRAMQAMGMAPGLLQGQFLPSDIARSIGKERTARTQLEKTDGIQKFESQRNNQLRTLQEQAGLINPLLGQGRSGTSTGAINNQSNPLQSALGGALIGYDLFGTGGGGETLPDWTGNPSRPFDYDSPGDPGYEEF